MWVIIREPVCISLVVWSIVREEGVLTSIPISEMIVSCDESFYTRSAAVLPAKQPQTTGAGKTYSINIPQTPSPTPHKMRTQRRLTTPSRNTTKRRQHPRRTQHTHPDNTSRHHRRQTIQHHAQVVEDVRGEAVPLAFWLEGCADAVGECDCCEAGGCVLEGGEEERCCWGCGWVADSDA